MKSGCRCCATSLSYFQQAEEQGDVSPDLALAAYNFASLCRAHNDSPCAWACTLRSDAYDWLCAFSAVTN
nr:MAG TPA: hypothetical protein [Inoviridae sp.]